MIEKAKKEIPMLPDERKKVYVEKGISEVNAKKIVLNRSLSDYLNEMLDEKTNFKIASNIRRYFSIS